MHLVESGEDPNSTVIDDIELMKYLHVNRQALITTIEGINLTTAFMIKDLFDLGEGTNCSLMMTFSSRDTLM